MLQGLADCQTPVGIQVMLVGDTEGDPAGEGGTPGSRTESQVSVGTVKVSSLLPGKSPLSTPTSLHPYTYIH